MTMILTKKKIFFPSCFAIVSLSIEGENWTSGSFVVNNVSLLSNFYFIYFYLIFISSGSVTREVCADQHYPDYP